MTPTSHTIQASRPSGGGEGKGGGHMGHLMEDRMNWLPIETAPKDGTEVVAWGTFADGGPAEFAAIVFYSPSFGWCIPAHMNNHMVPMIPRLWHKISAPQSE